MRNLRLWILEKEVLGDFEKVEGRPTWMIQHPALLKADLDRVMEEMVDDNTRAKEGLKLAQELCKSM